MVARKTILLVEDNPDDVALMLRAFQKVNLPNDVVVARSGEEALAYLLDKASRSHPDPSSFPSLVLLDLNLPAMNGLEVLSRLRQQETTKFLPIVVLTTSDDERDIQQAYRFGANSFIRKPIDHLQFLESVRQLGLYWLLLNETSETEGR